MKNNRILALILTLCMMFGLMQFPASASAPVFTATATSPIVYADALYTYAAIPDGIDGEGYTVYYTEIPAEITFAESEYYANSLTDYQKGIYRAAMDVLCDIESDALAVKQKVIIQYTTTEPASITTQEELNTLANNKLNEEAPKLDIQRLYNAIQYDHTELFWARKMAGGVGVNASYDGTNAILNWTVMIAVDASENFDSDEALILAANEMDSAVEMIISDAPTTGEHDLLVYFNDWLKANNTYNNTHLENDNYPLAHTAYSAFTSDNDEPTGPVCQGYAYALKYLCDLAGIHSVIVTGDLYQTGSAPGPHAWNAVELDGKWYAIDTTANDSLSTDVYNFLAGSTTASHDPGYPTFSSSHVVDDIHTYPTLNATAYEPPTPCDFTYTIANGEVTITGYVGSATEIEIPATIEGYPVKTVGSSAFYQCTSLTAVTFPDSVETIGGYAFLGCYSLVTVNFGSNIKTINSQAFAGCGFATITVPKSVTKLDNTAFSGNSLVAINVDAENDYYSSEDGVLFNKYKTKLLAYPMAKPGNTYAIPSSVTRIDSFAFSDNLYLTTITIPSTVATIGNHSFSYSASLETVVIDEGVGTIEYCAFLGCEALTSITIPESLKTIGRNNFINTTALNDVYYAGSTADKALISIAENNSYLLNATWHYAKCSHSYDNACDTNCNDCDATREVPDHVYDDADDYDCNECGAVRYFSYIAVGENAVITGYTGPAEELYIPDEIDEHPVIGIADFAFYNNTTIVTVRFPSTLRYIGAYAFYGCTALLGNSTATVWSVRSTPTTVLTIPDSVTSIGEYAFGGCESLEEVSLGSSVETIGEGAFSDCSALTTVNIPKSVTEIGTQAFAGCDSLTAVNYEGTVADKENINFGGSNDDLLDSWQNARLPGDVNNDGTVNNKDFGVLRQYLNHWDVEISESNADVNADGFVNNKDMGILRQYLNHWDVTLK